MSSSPTEPTAPDSHLPEGSPERPQPVQVIVTMPVAEHGFLVLQDRGTDEPGSPVHVIARGEEGDVLVHAPRGVGLMCSERHSPVNVCIEVYDSDPGADPALWTSTETTSFEALDHLSLETATQGPCALVFLRRRGIWAVRAHKRAAGNAGTEDWLLQLWPTEPRTNSDIQPTTTAVAPNANMIRDRLSILGIDPVRPPGHPR